MTAAPNQGIHALLQDLPQYGSDKDFRTRKTGSVICISQGVRSNLDRGWLCLGSKRTVLRPAPYGTTCSNFCARFPVSTSVV